eukprot:m.130135 g.130135  ORF g.130135 m.130135 type:complete len:104 (+) comp22365_c0_seq5:1895-2206(+)
MSYLGLILAPITSVGIALVGDNHLKSMMLPSRQGVVSQQVFGLKVGVRHSRFLLRRSMANNLVSMWNPLPPVVEWLPTQSRLSTMRAFHRQFGNVFIAQTSPL